MKDISIDIEIAKRLSVLNNEDEFIIKPFHNRNLRKTGFIESGKIVSRLNKTLFDYQIGDTENSSTTKAIFKQRVVLLNPRTKEVIIELYHYRLPTLCNVFCKHAVQCLITQNGRSQSIGSIRNRLHLRKQWYDVYDSKRDRVMSLTQHTSYIRSKIQNQVSEFVILDSDESTNIGRIYPFSTDLERSGYGKATAMKIPQDLEVEMKATLLIGTLMLVMCSAIK